MRFLRPEELLEPTLRLLCGLVQQRADQLAREIAAKLAIEEEERRKAREREELQTWFARANPPNNDIVRLNVRGRKFETTFSTLTKYPRSKLGILFSDRA
jgi:hypothetical protein